MKQIVLFDLDGTLTDPGVGITNSFIYALDKFGICVEDRRELYQFIGPPLWNSFVDSYGFTEKQADKAVEYYREYYREKGIFENLIYDGIESTLQTLKDRGCILVVATSKPELFAVQILEHFKLRQYFDVIAGSDFENVRNTKTKVIDYALNKLAQQLGEEVLVLRQAAIMVGDRFHDVIGAKENGIPSIGVLFGYGDREELECAGVDFVIERPEDILEIIV